MKKKKFTLADCDVSHPANCRCGGTLRCLHCDQEFPQTAKVEGFGTYIVVECPECHCMTPFQMERTA